MENAKKLLAQVQAALDTADTQEANLIGAHLSVPMQILIERIADGDLPDSYYMLNN